MQLSRVYNSPLRTQHRVRPCALFLLPPYPQIALEPIPKSPPTGFAMRSTAPRITRCLPSQILPGAVGRHVCRAKCVALATVAGLGEFGGGL